MLMNDDTNWTPISLSNIFTNYHGKRLVQQHRIPGPIPLLTAGKTNNGIAGFVSNDMQNTEILYQLICSATRLFIHIGPQEMTIFIF